MEQLLVYQKALVAAHRVSELVERTALRNDFDLAGQIGRSSVRVVSDISEGFEQKTDRHFAKYLYDARGSAAEITPHLAIAVGRRRITNEQATEVSGQYEDIRSMLTGLIKRLDVDGWTDRGDAPKD